MSLLEGYATGEFTPPRPPPKAIPEFAWLRAHYRKVAQEPDFLEHSAAEQWQELVNQVLRSDAAMSWRELDAVPVEARDSILAWLKATSDLDRRHGLTLRAVAFVGDGPGMEKRRAFQYEVLGLPPGQSAFIANFDGGWRILRYIDSASSHWGKPHLTTEDAVDTLARTLDDDST